MNTSWEDIQLFLAIAETGSLTAAARRLQTSQATVSRRLLALEAALREPLFQRTIRGVSLTPLGESLLAPSRQVAEWAAEFARIADRADTAPRGVVRLTAAPGVASELVVPFATRLREQLPEVRLQVVASIDYLDLGRREADLALRLQRPTQRDVVCLASVQSPVVALASRDYVARLPRGYKLGDAGWISWAPPLDHLPPAPQLAALIPGFRPVFAADDYLVQLRAAEAGLGAIIFSRLRHPRALPTTLVELAIDLGPLRSEMHLVAARAALDIPRVRAVADLLADEMAQLNRAAQGKTPRSRGSKDRGSKASTSSRR